MGSRCFGDRLVEAVCRAGTPACVGLDPVYARLPAAVRAKHDERTGRLDALREFASRVLEVVAEHVGVVKINIAFFEPYRGRGVDAYFELVAHARALGLIVIGDVKRGDIGHTSASYAAAHLSAADGPDGVDGPDAITLNAYFGTDGVKPYFDFCRAQAKGIFVLVHTSNPSAGEVQHVATAGGGNVAERVAGLVHLWSRQEGMIGPSGYSAVGAVVAPGDTAQARRLRTLMPASIFLVPGFGAQGRSVEQVAACFKSDGSGAIVNSSREVIFAYERPELAPASPEAWIDSVQQACRGFVEALSTFV